MTTSRTYVGIDVAQAKLDVASEPPGLTTTIPNTDAGLHTLVPQLQALAPERIVVEATGGYELPVVRALVEAGLPVIVVNPRQVRDFAKATGQLAKTDTLDAQMLALFAARVQPPVRPHPTAATTALTALLARRRQVIEMLTAERHRLGKAPPALRPGIQAHIAWLTQQVTTPGRRPHHADSAEPRVAGAGRHAAKCARRRPRPEPHPRGSVVGIGHLDPPTDRGPGGRRPPQSR